MGVAVVQIISLKRMRNLRSVHHRTKVPLLNIKKKGNSLCRLLFRQKKAVRLPSIKKINKMHEN